MDFSNNTKLKLFIFLILLNAILRCPVPFQEIGDDSFEVHIVSNSLSQFGEARWLLSPLSILGMYPMSVQGSYPFILSGFSQSSGIKMQWVTFLIPFMMGIFSIFTSYVLAKTLSDNDLFPFLVALIFSTSSGIVTYTTYTLPNRGLFVVLMPIFIYLLLKSRSAMIKYVLLSFSFFVLLYATHHMTYFFATFIVGYVIVSLYLLTAKYTYERYNVKHIQRFVPFFIILSMFLTFFYPFFTGFLVSGSRYQVFEMLSNFIRYIGVLFVFSLGGVGYLMFKTNKSFEEWVFLVSLIFLIPLFYSQTYMKWFILIILSLLIGMGLINIFNKLTTTNYHKKIVIGLIVLLLISTTSFTGYYQYLYAYRENPYDERFIEESTFKGGLWMTENINGYAVSNDFIYSKRICAISNIPFLLHTNAINQIYGFINISELNFFMYPFSSEKFWYDAYKINGADPSEVKWDGINEGEFLPSEVNISYFAENTKTYGNVFWNHGSYPSKLLEYAHKERYCIYDNGGTNIWTLF